MQKCTLGRRWGKIVEKDILEQTSASGTKKRHKPFVIKKKQLHSFWFIASAL